MFHFGSGTGFELFGLQLTFVQLLSSARAFGNEPGYIFAIFILISFLHSKITGITEHALLVTVEKVPSGHDVVDIGYGGINAVNQTERVVYANVPFQAKIILFVFLGLMHFGRSDDSVGLATLVLGGTRRRNDGGIDNAAFAQHQAVFLQVFVHLFEKNLAKAVVLQEMPEVENGSFIRQAIQLQTGKVPHRFNLVGGVCNSGDSIAGGNSKSLSFLTASGAAFFHPF